jgi:hypothetical protein
VSGTVVEVISTEASLHQNFTVKNVSGAVNVLRVERTKIIVITWYVRLFVLGCRLL